MSICLFAQKFISPMVLSSKVKKGDFAVAHALDRAMDLTHDHTQDVILSCSYIYTVESRYNELYRVNSSFYWEFAEPVERFFS